MTKDIANHKYKRTSDDNKPCGPYWLLPDVKRVLVFSSIWWFFIGWVCSGIMHGRNFPFF